MSKVMRFQNSTEFIKHVIERADKNPDVIIGLGPNCFSYFSSGAWISGYFHHNGKFYDNFTIYKTANSRHGNLGGLETCEFIIKEIRKVTDNFYYNGNRNHKKEKPIQNKLAKLFE